MNATLSSALIRMAIRSATIAIAIAMEMAGMLEQTNTRTNDKQQHTELENCERVSEPSRSI